MDEPFLFRAHLRFPRSYLFGNKPGIDKGIDVSGDVLLSE
jgi:hypothetical protein